MDYTFRVGAHNAHYEGSYSESAMRWRRYGSADKARNLAALLGARRVEVRSVVEVGCGTGAVLNAVKKAGIGQAHQGWDLADPNPHADAEGEGLALSKYDGRRLPLADKSVDLVYASHVLEHVPDERGFLAEMARVAAKFIYIEVPCELHVRSSARTLQPTLNIGHINAYTPEAYALKLVTSGLEIQEFRLFDHSYKVHAFHAGALRALAKMALRRPLLAVSPQLASRLFTYHCGALCVAR